MLILKRGYPGDFDPVDERIYALMLAELEPALVLAALRSPECETTFRPSVGLIRAVVRRLSGDTTGSRRRPGGPSAAEAQPSAEAIAAYEARAVARLVLESETSS